MTEVFSKRLGAPVVALALCIAGAVPAFAQSADDGYRPHDSYGGADDAYRPGETTYRGGANDAYRAPADPYQGGGDSYSPGGDPYARQGSGDTYRQPPDSYGRGGDGYRPRDNYGRGGGDGRQQYGRTYTDPGQPAPRGAPDYGEPYGPPGQAYGPPGEPPPGGPPPGPRATYEQNEIIGAGHNFFGAVSKGLASAVEYAFQSQGRPNGYILGEDAGGAFILGLRYGEGMLYTKDAGDHKVFWQGPSVGYDAGAEGSKTMVLVYNLRDPGEIYNRFGGVQGAAYLVGGVSVQFQKYGDVTLGIIRSGLGVRLGANVGYLKYTREPTWNPL